MKLLGKNFMVEGNSRAVRCKSATKGAFRQIIFIPGILFTNAMVLILKNNLSQRDHHTKLKLMNQN